MHLDSRGTNLETHDETDELNKRICNPKENINSLKGFEIIAEAFVYKIYDLFGRNMLLTSLYQVGSGPGKVIADRIKQKYDKETFELLEAFELLLTELKDFYSVQVKSIERNELERSIRIVIENQCFLREPIKRRKKLEPGKALCRISKGYFESAFTSLLGKKLKKIDINFLRNDDLRDMCIEELIFYF